MRFVSCLLDGDAALGLGLVDDDVITVRPVRLRGSERPVTDLVTLIDDWPAIRNELVAAEDTGPGGAGAADAGLGSRPLSGCVLLPPVRTDRNVICVGRDDREHAAEFSRSGFDASDSSGSSAASGDAAPARPVVFTKAATCLIGAGDAIDPHPGVTAARSWGEPAPSGTCPQVSVSRTSAIPPSRHPPERPSRKRPCQAISRR
jgi:hypothetical protein